MCNIGSANPTALVDGLADAVLGPMPLPPAGDVPPHEDGLYVDLERASTVRIGTKDRQTTVGGSFLHARKDARFQIGHYRVVELHPDSIDVTDASSRTHHYVPAAPPKVTSALAGRYHSDEVAADCGFSSWQDAGLPVHEGREP